MVLGQVKTDEKSNEIAAIPKLLEMLYLEGCPVTMDGIYVISLKGNHPTLHAQVEDFFGEARLERFETVAHTFFETFDEGHGRIEKRRCWLTAQLDNFRQRGEWAGLTSLGMVEAERTKEGRHLPRRALLHQQPAR